MSDNVAFALMFALIPLSALLGIWIGNHLYDRWHRR